MESLAVLFIAALVFGICFAVDKAFARLFRSKAQHRSGLAVRANKNYGLFGVVLTIVGILAVVVGLTNGSLLGIFGAVVLLMGICFIVHYLSFGIFYDGESFLVSGFGKKSIVYRYQDILQQKLYLVQGGNLIIELQMGNGSTVSLQSAMDGVLPFLDTAFAGWCLQKGIDPASCDFHDPSKSWWFPHEEEV